MPISASKPSRVSNQHFKATHPFHTSSFPHLTSVESQDLKRRKQKAREPVQHQVLTRTLPRNATPDLNETTWAPTGPREPMASLLPSTSMLSMDSNSLHSNVISCTSERARASYTSVPYVPELLTHHQTFTHPQHAHSHKTTRST